MRHWLLLCVVTAAASLVASAREIAPHEIRFDFTTQQPIALVSVNGGRQVPFVFDTGASINVIDEDIAREAGVVATGGRAMTGGGEAAVHARFASGLTLQTAALQWDDQRGAILPLGYPGAKHYAGLIGAPILMRYAARFDFAGGVLHLIDPAAYEAPPGAVLVPFELQEDLPLVRATVDAGRGAIEARLMVDTGAGSSVADLNRPFVDAHRLLEAIRDAAPHARPAGIGGSAPFVYGTGTRLVLGSLVFDRPRLGLSRATEGSSSRGQRDGIIGNELLKRFVATFDYARRRLVLESPGPASKK